MRPDHILFLSDLDGTFLGDPPAVLPQNLAAVRRFISLGGHFAFASGRSHHDLRAILPEIDRLTSLPCIVSNGAYCYDYRHDRVENPHFLAQEDLDRLPVRLSELSGLPFRRWNRYLGEAEPAPPAAGEGGVLCYDTGLAGGLFKIIGFLHPDTAGRVAGLIPRLFAEFPSYSFVLSASTILDVLPRGVSKALQLKHLRERLLREGVLSPRVFCIGDYDNDLEMLSAADFPLCPANASPAVKAICRREVCHCRNGAVAEALSLILDEKI